MELEDTARLHRFKMSYIVGDQVLGDEKYFYMTGHDASMDLMSLRMNALTDAVRKLGHAKMVRRKIEKIVLDERVS